TAPASFFWGEGVATAPVLRPSGSSHTGADFPTSSADFPSLIEKLEENWRRFVDWSTLRPKRRASALSPRGEGRWFSRGGSSRSSRLWRCWQGVAVSPRLRAERLEPGACPREEAAAERGGAAEAPEARAVPVARAACPNAPSPNPPIRTTGGEIRIATG